MSRSLPLSALAALAPTAAAACVGFGVEGLDARLGGGLQLAALHEFYAAREGDEVAAAGMALLLALRCDRPGPLLWLREERARRACRPYGLGLAELGHDPARLVLVEAPDTLALLRAGAESVACAAVAAVILEPWGKAGAADLTATRRLALAAARSGVLALLVRQGSPVPSAALSRWQVAAAISRALPADAPGLPTFDLRLLRHRGGVAEISTRLEWDRDRQSFATPLPGAAPAAAADRAGAAQAIAA